MWWGESSKDQCLEMVRRSQQDPGRVAMSDIVDGFQTTQELGGISVAGEEKSQRVTDHRAAKC